MDEFFIVVDIESAGPNPGSYALLSIGACTIGQPRQTFYIELQPDLLAEDPEASKIHNLSLVELTRIGTPPRDAMSQFADWVEKTTPPKSTPVFTAFNAPFDWMFINDYFHRYLNRNPFGHKALDIKVLYMGKYGVNWLATSHKQISKFFKSTDSLSHHALEDAQHEAELLKNILRE